MKNKEDYQIDKYGMIKTGDMEWTSQTHISVVKLTDKEIKVCEYSKIDQEKVLLVKRCLVNGMTVSDIYNVHGIARSTVRKYREILKSSLQTLVKLQSNSSQTPTNKKNGVSLLLFFNVLGTQTPVWYLALFFALLGAPFFVRALQKRAFDKRQARRKEIRPLRIDFYTAMDLKYRRRAIVAKTEKEKQYFKHLLRKYSNRDRQLFLVESLSGETAINHSMRREKTAAQYNMNNALLVKNSEIKYLAAMDALYHEGKLDYFHSNDKEKRAASEQWLKEFVKPILERQAKDHLQPLTAQV